MCVIFLLWTIIEAFVAIPSSHIHITIPYYTIIVYVITQKTLYIIMYLLNILVSIWHGNPPSYSDFTFSFPVKN